MFLKKIFGITNLYKKWYFILPASLLITIAVFYLNSLNSFQHMERQTMDTMFRYFPTPALADTNIVLVAIDDNSLKYTRENRIMWPWPRSFYAVILDYFNAGGAKSILFDIQFYEPDLDRFETSSEETDGEFADAIWRHKNIVLSSQLIPDDSDVDPALFNYSLNDCNIPFKIPEYQGILTPINMLLEATDNLGMINVVPDPDGVIRRVPMIYKFKNKLFPQMAFEGLRYELGKNKSYSFDKRNLIIDKHKIPLDNKGNFVINWYDKGGTSSPFKYYSMGAILSSSTKLLMGKNPTIKPEKFKNKHIIIGATAAGLLDLKTTPTDKIFPGMEIWATTLSNLINEHYLRSISNSYLLLLLFLIIVIVAFAFSLFTDKYTYPILLLILIIIISVFIFFWINNKIYIPLPSLLVGYFSSFFIFTTLSYFIEGKSKLQIKRIFSRYLHPEVINSLIKSPDQIEMGGKEIFASVLFTDIANFTTFSEGKTPKQIVTNLNNYFEKLTQFVLNQNGFLDKYTGDGIMALFGVPILTEDHALRACKTALQNKKYCIELGKIDKQSTAAFFHNNTRIGIHTGDFIAGNIGSEKRMDFTAIGDTVNLSARLEGVNKIYNTSIIISESTYNEVKNHMICRELDYLRVKGKLEPTRIYELIDEKNVTLDVSWITIYEKGLKAYRNALWDNAIENFSKVYEKINDGAAKVMLDRCKYLKENPPANWDGILTLEVK